MKLVAKPAVDDHDGGRNADSCHCTGSPSRCPIADEKASGERHRNRRADRYQVATSGTARARKSACGVPLVAVTAKSRLPYYAAGDGASEGE